MTTETAVARVTTTFDGRQEPARAWGVVVYLTDGRHAGGVGESRDAAIEEAMGTLDAEVAG